MRQYIFFFIILIGYILPAKATGSTDKDKKTTFHITVLNTEGNPQTGMIMKIGTYSTEYVSDEEGLIEFKHEINEKNIRTANFYFPSDKKKIVRTLRLDEAATDTILRIDSQNDLIRYKQSGKTFPVSGIIKNGGMPVRNAEIIIQGTGRNTFSDAQGRFTIEADYNHTIMVRAEKMENLYIDVDKFLQNPDIPYPVHMTRKGFDRIYTSVEQMPEYPGGMKAFFNYVRRKARTSERAAETGKEGTVMIQFVVEKDGSVTSPHIVRGFDTELDTVAFDAIVTMRDWIPAKDHGIVVRCKYSVPVSFKLPKPKNPEKEPTPALAKNDSLRTDSLMTGPAARDSLKLTPIPQSRDSLVLHKDSIHITPQTTDSLSTSLKADSLTIGKADTLRTDSLSQPVQAQATEVKPKKRNVFIRFFRWLFGIKDKDKKETKEAGQPETVAIRQENSPGNKASE